MNISDRYKTLDLSSHQAIHDMQWHCHMLNRQSRHKQLDHLDHVPNHANFDLGYAQAMLVVLLMERKYKIRLREPTMSKEQMLIHIIYLYSEFIPISQ